MGEARRDNACRIDARSAWIWFYLPLASAPSDRPLDGRADHGSPQGCACGGVFLSPISLYEQRNGVARVRRCQLTKRGRSGGRKNHRPPIKVQWSYFARFYVHTLHNSPLIRASNFLCLHKESHQRNAPHEAALRASRGLTSSNRVAPTRHPVATVLNAPSMALCPGLRRPVRGGFKRGRKSKTKFTHCVRKLSPSNQRQPRRKTCTPTCVP